MLKIAVIGCGTGQATVLKALDILARKTRRKLHVSAIVGVTDNGGHSGLLRRQLGIPQVGDTRACLVAAARNDFLAALLDHRFSESKLKGVCLGNLLLAAEIARRGSLVAAADTFCDALHTSSLGSSKCRGVRGREWHGCPTREESWAGCPCHRGREWHGRPAREESWAGCPCHRGRVSASPFFPLMLSHEPDAGRVECDFTVIPVSDGQADICAELENGKVIRGEWQIIRRRPRTAIARLFHKPELVAHPTACRVLREAQLIIIAPGSLRTGIISVLLAEGIRKTIRRSRAPILYVSNMMTQPGQTDGFSLTDHVAELAKYIGRVPALVVANCGRPAASVLHEYHAAGSEIVRFATDKGKPRTGAWRLCWSVERTGGSRAKEAETIVLAADLVHGASLRGILRLDRVSGAGMAAGPHIIRHDPEKLASLLGSRLRIVSGF